MLLTTEQILPKGGMLKPSNIKNEMHNGHKRSILEENIIFTMKSKDQHGWQMSSRFQRDGTHHQSQKIKNQKQRSYNGNRLNQLKIVHWNLGARQWRNKQTDIEVLLTDYKPDICFITEANLWDDHEEHEKVIQGHYMILPNTMKKMKHARIVCLVREGLIVTKLNEFMDDMTATIWISVGSNKKKALRIGGLYREHQQLGMGDGNASRLELQLRQEDRWRKMLRNWKNAGRNKNCIVIGDINLDYIKWNEPEHHLEKMVEETQRSIETEGFVQLVSKITRTWKNQTDSTLDHIWTNCNRKTIKYFNEVRGVSDHNVIGIHVALKDLKSCGQNIRRRKWNKFDKAKCLDKLKNVNWEELYRISSPDVANTLLEEVIRKILDEEAPMGTIQVRNHYSKWLSDETKEVMKKRDSEREIARVTKVDRNWDNYRDLRNKSTKLQRRDKKIFMEKMYRQIEIENDTGKLFSMTKQVLGWKTGSSPASFQINGKTIRKQKELADVQADFYRNKIKKNKN